MERKTENSDIDEERSPEINRNSILSFSVDSKQEPASRSIAIKETQFRDIKFSKKIVYLIVGSDQNGTFEILRRYKEFYLLRSTLVEWWPGFYIPKIPSKQKIVNFIQGNTDPAFIEKRKKLLESFLKKISNLEYIYKSKQFQLFIRENGNYKTLLKSLPILDIKIAETIITTFPRFLADTPADNIEEKYSESEKAFKSALQSLTDFKDQCLPCVENFDVFESDLITFMGELKEMGSIFVQKKLEIPNRESFVNPYVILLDWANAEILDVESIIEAIDCRKKYLNVIEKFENKLESNRKTLTRVQSGKKSLSQMFSKLSKEDLSAKSLQDIENLETDIKSLKNCYKIISLRLINKEIFMFKQAKLETYKHIMKLFATASIQELTILVQEAKYLEFFIEN